jgi:hypothetical protein
MVVFAWKEQPKRRTFVRGRLNLDSTTVRLHDLPDNTEPNAESISGRKPLGSVEGLKDSAALASGNRLTGVLNLDQDLARQRIGA